MNEWLTRVIDNSEANGEEKGTIKTLMNMISKKKIGYEEAAEEVGCSVEAFKEKAKALLAEDGVSYDAMKNVD